MHAFSAFINNGRCYDRIMPITMTEELYEIEVGDTRWRGTWDEICHLKHHLGGPYPVYIIKPSKMNTDGTIGQDISESLPESNR